MKPGFPESPEDRLLDELLREQSHGPDVAFLRRIEAAVDARRQPVAIQRPATGSPKWLAIAAGIALAAGAGMWWQASEQPAAAPTTTKTAPPDETPTSVKTQRPKSIAETPRKDRLAPRNPIDAPQRGTTEDNLAANHNLPEPNPFGEMSSLPSLTTHDSRGGALAGSSNGKLLSRLPGQAADDRAGFAEWVRQPTGNGNHGLPAPAMIIPKGVPKGSNIKEHYGKPNEKKETPTTTDPRP